ncbi:hypothetical protein ABZ754_20500 [Micromonospora purpureochromogenes]|uniref:hypothetical protein n=1 Tax=Micromonospora purpureochromogenes TaxID=47872 RepID=UPI0033E93545
MYQSPGQPAERCHIPARRPASPDAASDEARRPASAPTVLLVTGLSLPMLLRLTRPAGLRTE